MADQIDPKLAKQVAKTQELLLPFVKKSLLVEKHLARPPFRQLHDIFMNISESTPFFKGLFTPEELDYGNIKTKDAKVVFLQKIIDVLSLSTGQTIGVKPGKILAGQEVEKTNDFLQSLAKALKEDVNSQEAINTVVGKVGGAVSDAGAAGKKSNEVKTKETPKPAPTGNKPRSKDPSPARKPQPKPSNAPAATAANKSKDKRSPAPAATKPSPSQATTKAKGSNERLNNTNKQQQAKSQQLASKSTNNTTNIKKPDETSGVKSRRGSLTNQAEPPAKTAAAAGIRPRSGSLGSIQRKSDHPEKPGGSTSVGDVRNEGGVPEEIVLAEDSESEVEPQSQPLSVELGNVDENDKENSSTIIGTMHENINANAVLEQKVDQLESTSDAKVPGSTSKARQPPPPSAGVNSSRPTVPPSAMGTRGPVVATHRIAGVINEAAPGPVPQQPQAGRESDEESRAGFFSSRPLSARPGAPRPRTAASNWSQEESRPFRPPTSKVASVLLDTNKQNTIDDDDDESGFIIQDKTSVSNDDPLVGFGYGKFGEDGNNMMISEDNMNIEELAPEQRGFLVNQILETKKELEDKSNSGIEPELNESERSKLHQVWENEMETLKTLLQQIARSSNPLGKLMDFVQEDIDTMLNELTKYKDENRNLDLLLEDEQRKLKQELAPLQRQLDEMDYLIKDEEDAVIATKLDILEQEQKIDKILHGLESFPKNGTTAGLKTFDPKMLPKNLKIFGTDVNFDDSSKSTTNVNSGFNFNYTPAGIDTIIEPAYDNSSPVHLSNVYGMKTKAMAAADGDVEPSFLQVPEEDLNSLVMDDMDDEEE